MASNMPRVSKSGMDVPAGPTGHLSSGRKGAKLGGGTATRGNSSGLTCSPMSPALGKGAKAPSRAMRGGRGR